MTSHRWNQGKQETTDPSNFLDMRRIGGGLGWDACFHTYGTRITPEELSRYGKIELFTDFIRVYAG